MGEELTRYCEIAAWAAHTRCRELFDACGELFDKFSVEVEASSELGLRLAFFDFHYRVLNTNPADLQTYVAVMEAASYIVSRDCQRISKHLFVKINCMFSGKTSNRC
jgi:hypothetical protein